MSDLFCFACVALFSLVLILVVGYFIYDFIVEVILDLEDDVKSKIGNILTYFILICYIIINLIFTFDPTSIELTRIFGISSLVTIISYFLYKYFYSRKEKKYETKYNSSSEIMKEKYCKEGLQIFEYLGYFGGVTAVVLFIVVFIFNPGMLQKTVKENVNTFELAEVDESEDIYFSGGIYYLKSEPGMTYYISYKNEEDAIETISINGNKNKVQKYEDDKYVNNPYVEIYRVEEVYTLLFPYVHEEKRFLNDEYDIYIPKKSTIYVTNE